MARRIKVALIHQPWSVVEPPVRGADSVAFLTDEIAHRLAKKCDVVCYSRRWKDQESTSEHEGIQYRRMNVSIDTWIRGGMKLLGEKGILSNPTKPFHASRWFSWQYISKVIADLRRDPPDVVHIQNFSQFAPMIRRALPDVRIMLHMHAEWLTALDRRMIQGRIKTIDSMIFCSNYFARQTRLAWPEYADRCHVVYNGMTLSEFAGKKESPHDATAPRILFVSRVSPDKGVHVLIDAFAKIVEKYPQAQLKIVGPWALLPKSFCIDHSHEKIITDLLAFYGRPYVDQLRERMTPATAERIEITGMVSREDLIGHYQWADLLAMPSIYPEGFSIPIVEAAACRVPAVVTRRGGMPEVVDDGKTGLIVPPADADALANALLELLDDPARRQRMGQAAYERAIRNFTWDRVAESLVQQYNAMLNPPESEMPDSMRFPCEPQRSDFRNAI